MNVVDIDKLAMCREMVDLDISELCMSRDFTIPQATMVYATEQLAHSVVVVGSWGSRWWSALAMPVRFLESATQATDAEDSEIDIERARDVAKFIRENTYASLQAYDAAVASLCRVIQSDCDIVMPKEDCERYFTRSDIQDLACCSVLRLSPPELDSDRLLFESEGQYYRRMNMILTGGEVVKQTLESFGISPGPRRLRA